MTGIELREHAHCRLNPLSGEWILVSPHRTQRPWQGQTERIETEQLPEYDPSCYMCPGNLRASGARNPSYAGTFVFDNDFPALLAGTAPAEQNVENLIVSHAEPGICRVVCFSPTMVLPRRHFAGLDAPTSEERDGLADILHRLGKCYDQVFGVSFPYSMGFHQKPADEEEHPEWHLHAHFFPPLLRSATVRKFMVGYEMFCMPQRDILPEEAADRLRKSADG